MALSRFFLPAAAWQPGQLTLSGDEAAHCARVLRRQVGDAVEVFDGRGRVARGLISSAGKNTVSVLLEEVLVHAPAANPVWLFPAMIKQEPFEWLLEKAAELGAARIQPVVTARTVVHLRGDHLEKKLLKWRRHMIESAKQCHTPWVPELAAPLPLAAALGALPADSLRILPALSEQARRIHQLDLRTPRPVCLLTGPEGDFTPEEEELACRQGFQPVTLGPLILRAETAAIAALAAVGHEVDRQGGECSVCRAIHGTLMESLSDDH